jgi:peptidoglycan/xylan/chitin deacetylase (PgdA/CDA1 family)
MYCLPDSGVGAGEIAVKRSLLAVGLSLAFGLAISSPFLCGAQEEPRSPGMLSFVFDDGFETDRTQALDVFAGLGCVASSAVIVDRIGHSGYMSADQIRELQAAGWEIMSHTVSHPNLRVASAARIEAELGGSFEDLRALGFDVRNLVYPYNKSDKLVEEIAGRYYRSGRGGGREFNDASTPRTLLRSFEIKDDPLRIERIIDESARRGVWLILYHHRMMEKVYLSSSGGRFKTDETLSFSPSGATARFEPTIWNRIGRSLYLVPISGAVRPGDRAVGEESGAWALVGELRCDDREIFRSLIEYARANHPRMRIVTIDQGLDALGAAKAPDPGR